MITRPTSSIPFATAVTTKPVGQEKSATIKASQHVVMQQTNNNNVPVAIRQDAQEKYRMELNRQIEARSMAKQRERTADSLEADTGLRFAKRNEANKLAYKNELDRQVADKVAAQASVRSLVKEDQYHSQSSKHQELTQ